MSLDHPCDALMCRAPLDTLAAGCLLWHKSAQCVRASRLHGEVGGTQKGLRAALRCAGLLL